MVDYSQVDMPEHDPEGRVLDALAGNMPYVFVVATSLDPLELRAQTGLDLETMRVLLIQALKALPDKESK